MLKFKIKAISMALRRPNDVQLPLMHAGVGVLVAVSLSLMRRK